MKRLLLVLSLAITFMGEAQITPVCYKNHSTQQALGSTSRRVITLNVNSDAFMDFAVANNITGNVSVYIGNGSAFATMTNTITTHSPYGLASGDFNSDGFVDLLAANGNTNTASLRLGNNTGNFGAPTHFTVSFGPQSIEAADFNLDGNLDFATSNFSSNNLTVRFGTGMGGFSAGVNYSVGLQPRTLKAEDVNGDGSKDILVVSGSSSSDMSVLLGSPSGTFAAPVNYTVTGGAFDLAIGDFNGDGNKDAAVCSSSNGMINILLGSSSGTFAATTSYSVGFMLYSIVAKDMNNDGKIDLVVSDFNGGTNNLKTLLGNGNGTFAAYTSYIPSQVNNFDLAAADFDNNGYVDLVLTTGVSAGNTARVVWNHPTPTVSIASSASLICVGQNVSLTGTGASTYSWSTGATSTSITVSPTITTSYSVVGTSTVNCASNAAFTLSVSACTSINEINNTQEFFVYPNPVRNNLHIESNEPIRHAEIFDLTGKLILTSSEREINIEALDQGMYIIRITFNNGGLSSEKIIKE